MNYKQALEELYAIKEWKFKLGLKNMRILLKKLGNPEKKLKCIHVTGTNGKGSVCAMISSVLMDAGYKVGMYTSPHLKKFNERIRINNKLISDKDATEYYLRVKKYVVNQSFFEITTAMAFLYFYEKKVDFAVLEVGMGGRLDSTNVITPLISIITNIGYEHTNRLGKTLGKIAHEKSGIIKNNIPVVTGTTGVALQTIKRIANKKNSELYAINNKKIIKKRFDKKGNIWHFDFDNYGDLTLDNLKGEFQIKNAIIAIKTLEILNNNNKIEINNKNIRNGLKKAEWAGRFQFLGKNILIDCAHNPHGFNTLFKELRYIHYNKLILVAGFSKGKDVGKISRIIKANKKIKKIILTEADNERAMPIREAAGYFNKKAVIKNNSKNALEYAEKIAKKNDLVLVCGSIYMVGELIK
ncbi:bifunctional folylpolyglutamate synthase/dihydrofolate synthase [Candidatus Woesearchaeota archaeon]|nr:bifunctional folylpolyglutamate synthase/dihydrofolate synthase [Candidatus Woesearchaeota archaeon]